MIDSSTTTLTNFNIDHQNRLVWFSRLELNLTASRCAELIFIVIRRCDFDLVPDGRRFPTKNDHDRLAQFRTQLWDSDDQKNKSREV